MTDHQKDDIPQTFFADQSEAIKFLVEGKEMGVASPDGQYVAMLSKESAGKWLYLLTSIKEDVFVGDYVRPFRCNQENIDQFHLGVRTLAEKMRQFEATPTDQRDEFFADFAEQENVFGRLGYVEADDVEVSEIAKQEKTGYFGNIIIKEFPEDGIQVLRTANGREAFVSNNEHSNMVPREVDPVSITLKECQELILRA